MSQAGYIISIDKPHQNAEDLQQQRQKYKKDTFTRNKLTNFSTNLLEKENATHVIPTAV